VAERENDEALGNAGRLLRSYADASLDAIYVKDRNSRWLFANPALQRITGKPIAELLGKTDVEIYSNPEIGRAIIANDKKVMESGTPETFEEHVDLPDGRHFFISVKSPRFDEKGNVNGLLGISHDITNRKRRELQLKESQQKYLDLVETTADFIWEMDTEGRLTYCSPQIEKLWGFKPAEMIGKTFFDVSPQAERERALDFFMGKIKSPKPVGGWEIASYDSKGRLIFLDSSGVPFFDKEGRLRGFRGITRDITERKKAEDELTRRNKELEDLKVQLEDKASEVEKYATSLEDLARKRLVQLRDAERLAAIGATAGMVGHDIRNPLQAISSDIYLALRELSDLPDSEQKQSIKENLESIDQAVDYINKIVQDLQDFARPITPVLKEVNLERLCEEVLFKIVPEKIDASSKVEINVKRIVTDPDLMKRVLTNLVNNAVQAMPGGGKLSLYAFPEARNVVISVSDTGVGIPEMIKPKLFSPLVTTKSKGQGFGLPVVKRTVDALGGSVSFVSEEGKGTTFSISLPRKG
jgi:PAS domain S-box-containing protein